MLVLTFLLCFVVAAFVSAAFFDFVWRCIGSPEFDERGRLEARGGMILSRYGRWVADKYNALEDARVMQAHEKAAATVLKPEELAQVREMYNLGSNDKAAQMLRGMIADGLIRGDRRLNWYSALGGCPFCFSVWVHLINAGAALYFIAPIFKLGGVAVGFCFVYFPAVAIAIRAYFSDRDGE